MYIRELFDKRPHLGDYHQLVQELRQADPEYHFKYFRMTKAKFDELLNLVYERIIHAPNHRRPIRPGERLAVTLRARRCVENAFGILVSRWRAFLGTVTGTPELLTDMVKAAVCLHNFLMADRAYCPDGYADEVSGDQIQDGSWRSAVTPVGAAAVPTSNRCSLAAMELRDQISNYILSAAGSVP
ncbi:hypothetical protein HPB50_002515 [Hyalomma asiaticum]|uniref:Uncharacterized protein n=1 Tax=Hyalomma asiaticum TaxID=266040 RepID=A0ACB7SD86_HYAAI|nr:hypothetical protein HPB50_002515 [Hyalomma asiaticum]